MKNAQDRSTVRQYGDYTAARKHAVNLRRNPTLHFQIGLILALLASLVFIEMRMPDKGEVKQTVELEDEEMLWVQEYQIEKKVVPVKKRSKPQVQLNLPPDTLIVDKDPEKNLEKTLFIDDPSDSSIIDDPDSVPYIEPVEPVGPVPVILVSEVPIFPGCEGLSSNDERRDCMSDKVAKLIKRKFNTDISSEVGLSGVNRIFVQFTVDKTGVVTDLVARGPHPKLEQEAKRVLGLLPNMKPGRQGDKNVGVIYSQPITYKVQD